MSTLPQKVGLQIESEFTAFHIEIDVLCLIKQVYKRSTRESCGGKLTLTYGVLTTIVTDLSSWSTLKVGVIMVERKKKKERKFGVFNFGVHSKKRVAFFCVTSVGSWFLKIFFAIRFDKNEKKVISR